MFDASILMQNPYQWEFITQAVQAVYLFLPKEAEASLYICKSSSLESFARISCQARYFRVFSSPKDGGLFWEIDRCVPRWWRSKASKNINKHEHT